MDRRHFLRSSIAAAGGAAMLPTTAMVARAGPVPTDGPYGSIEGVAPDANGLVLPPGFSSRVVGVSGEVVADTGYVWPIFPDGAATFDDGKGGWYHVVNSEVAVPNGLGGASSVHYDSTGTVLGAQRILGGTTSNCAGGPTPWGTWLSCEERLDDRGQVWECDPTGEQPATVLPALGRWSHEAVAVDPDTGTLYLTEDHAEGVVYRFTPDAYPDLSAGVLEAAIVASDGAVTWGAVPDPEATTVPTRAQAPGATVFPGNEGVWYHDGTIVFTSKRDNRVHAIDIAAQRYTLLWDGTPAADIAAGAAPREPLSGVDNITVSAASGDLYVAEDGGNLEVVLISTEGDVVPFARVAGDEHIASEVTGPVFDPSGDRLYFSSQRGPTPKTLREIEAATENDLAIGGITYEVTGPFRSTAVEESSNPTTTLAAASSAGSSPGDGGDDGVSGPVAVGVGAAAVGAGAAGVLWMRRRRGTP